MPSRDDIITAARECLETRWVHQGRLPGIGIDCVGVVLYAGRTRGVPGFENYEPPAYQRNAKWHEFLSHFEDHLIQVPNREARAGDVVCIRQDKFPCHCGILTTGADGQLWLVHSYAKRRKVVEERYSSGWRLLTRAVFQYPGLSE